MKTHILKAKATENMFNLHNLYSIHNNRYIIYEIWDIHISIELYIGIQQSNQIQQIQKIHAYIGDIVSDVVVIVVVVAYATIFIHMLDVECLPVCIICIFESLYFCADWIIYQFIILFAVVAGYCCCFCGCCCCFLIFFSFCSFYLKRFLCLNILFCLQLIFLFVFFSYFA